MINESPPTSEEWGLKDYISLIIRRKWIILIVFVLTFSIATYYHFNQPPIYKVTSTFTIESGDMGGLQQAQLLKGNNSRSFGFYKTLVNSRIFTKRIYEAVAKDSIYQEAKKIYDNSIGLNLTLNDTEYDDLFAIQVTACDPVIAYRYATIAVKEFKERCQEIELEESRNIVTFVNNQLKQAERNLEVSERKLQEFKKETNLNDMGQVDGGILQRLTEIETQLQEVETERQLAQANYDSYKQRLKQLKNPNTPSLFDVESSKVTNIREEIDKLETRKRQMAEEAELSSPQIAAIDNQLEQKKNDLRQAVLNAHGAPQSFDMNGESKNQMQLFNERIINEELNLYMLKNKERFLRSLLEKYRKQHPNILEHTIKFAQLQRKKKVNENLYNYLVERSEEAKISAATGTGGIRIVDAPSKPEKPQSPHTARNMAISLILACGLGFGVAFAFDYFDNSIYTVEDVQRLGELPVLGTIPFITNSNMPKEISVSKNDSSSVLTNFQDRMNGYRNRVIHSIDAKSPVVDAYRHIRTNLQFANVDNPINKVLVTSGLPGEGKTLTASNLALSYAELGKRVLIIDCDLRKPQQHMAFNSRKSPGLTDFLAKDIPVQKVIYCTNQHGLFLMPAGTSVPNPSEMLSSRKMYTMMTDLEADYDFIIFDSPPVIAVTDPVLLAPKVKNIILVIEFGKTDWHVAKDALTRLENVNVKVTGAILNGMKSGKGYGYYKYNYYSYQYSYYGEKPEKHHKKSRSIV